MASSGPPKPKGKAKVQVCNRIFSRLFYSLDGGFIFIIIFTPITGEMIQVDEHIFQKGWFNHQLLFDFWTYLGWSPVLGLVFWVVVSNIFIFTPTWGRFPIWLIFFKWVETTNQYWCTEWNTSSWMSLFLFEHRKLRMETGISNNLGSVDGSHVEFPDCVHTLRCGNRKIPIFKRQYLFNRSIFHCHLTFPEVSQWFSSCFLQCWY